MTGIRTIIVIAVIMSVASAVVWPAAPPASGGEDPILRIPVAQAVSSPVPLRLAVGQPLLIRMAPRIPTVVASSPDGMVHAVLRGTDVLVVPLREGAVRLAVGIGDGAAVRFTGVIGTGAGTPLRAVLLEPQEQSPSCPVTARQAPSVSAAATAPAPTAPPTPQSASQWQAFLSSLAPAQRRALMDYMAAPSPEAMRRLAGLLSPSQRDELAGFLGQQPAPPSAPERSPQAPAKAPASPPRGEGGLAVSDVAPAGIGVHAIPTRSPDGVLYVSYVLQNTTGRSVRADPRDLEVRGAVGDVQVRQMDVGTPGVIAPGTMETGVIALRPASSAERVVIFWRLRDEQGEEMPINVSVEVGRR
jgi:hypothetical protein